MKVLHVIDSGGFYGAEVMILNLMCEQVRMGLIPILASIGTPCCGEKPLETEARRRGLRVESFHMRPGPNISGALEIIRFTRHEGVKILHSHGYKGNILFGLMPRFLRKLPMVATLHGWTWTGGWDRMRLYEWLDRLSLRFIDQVVVVNGSMLEKVSSKRLHVVDNGIPIDGSEGSLRIENEKCHISSHIAAFCNDGIIIGAIGRLSPEKGYDVLLKAVSEAVVTCPDIKLVILGDGQERNFLNAQVKSLGLEQRVLMPGYVENARQYLSHFKMYILSSLTEGLPIVILEAMQAKVPIVATRVGGVPEVLENGKAGRLVIAGSCKSLVQGILDVINNPETAIQRVCVASQRLQDFYSCHSMAEKYMGVYQSLI
ncbi:glycosyltransferase [Desulfopila sp. IMCC35006]|uniref:glycosyltransferase n=1 Tax=Desulfopila sp. IMCC35006 TaxID=2569542 RepID=UPI0010AD7666|nr:glycosyltransferase [Desulfopila sp. IMCC35006]TKB23964.1 glycosyltransferase [Desulfopila sp. IMCC35006]